MLKKIENINKYRKILYLLVASPIIHGMSGDYGQKESNFKTKPLLINLTTEKEEEKTSINTNTEDLINFIKQKKEREKTYINTEGLINFINQKKEEEKTSINTEDLINFITKERNKRTEDLTQFINKKLPNPKEEKEKKEEEKTSINRENLINFITKKRNNRTQNSTQFINKKLPNPKEEKEKKEQEKKEKEEKEAQFIKFTKEMFDQLKADTCNFQQASQKLEIKYSDWYDTEQKNWNIYIVMKDTEFRTNSILKILEENIDFSQHQEITTILNKIINLVIGLVNPTEETNKIIYYDIICCEIICLNDVIFNWWRDIRKYASQISQIIMNWVEKIQPLLKQDIQNIVIYKSLQENLQENIKKYEKNVEKYEKNVEKYEKKEREFITLIQHIYNELQREILELQFLLVSNYQLLKDYESINEHDDKSINKEDYRIKIENKMHVIMENLRKLSIKIDIKEYQKREESEESEEIEENAIDTIDTIIKRLINNILPLKYINNPIETINNEVSLQVILQCSLTEIYQKIYLFFSLVSKFEVDKNGIKKITQFFQNKIPMKDRPQSKDSEYFNRVQEKYMEYRQGLPIYMENMEYMHMQGIPIYRKNIQKEEEEQISNISYINEKIKFGYNNKEWRLFHKDITKKNT